jgi:hypothetical protein
VEQLLTVSYDAGHPLRVDQSIVDVFLNTHFTSLMRAEYAAESHFRGRLSTYRELYFVGRKVASGRSSGPALTSSICQRSI